MTQLSNDIARSVGGISAVRHHGLRTKKRKTRTNGVGAHSSRKDDRIGMNGGKRIQVCWLPEIATLTCSTRLPPQISQHMLTEAIIVAKSGRSNSRVFKMRQDRDAGVAQRPRWAALQRMWTGVREAEAQVEIWVTTKRRQGEPALAALLYMCPLRYGILNTEIPWTVSWNYSESLKGYRRLA